MIHGCGAWFDDDSGDHTHECVEHSDPYLQRHQCAECGRTWWHSGASAC